MKFTVAIPAYKSKFLKECIDSVLAQTIDDFEVIVLNDASPENVDEIVLSYSDNRIKYYKNEKNVGAVDVVDNWNKCLEYATGDYFVCIGDDDKLLPNALEEYSKLIDKYPGLSVYHGQTEIINEDSQFANVTVRRPDYESVYSLIWHRWKCRYNQFVGDFLYDTKKLKEKGGYYKLPLAWGSDDITAAMAAADKGIANTQEAVFLYRVNRQTISASGSDVVKIEAMIKERLWYEDFLKKVPEDLQDRRYHVVLRAIINDYYAFRHEGTLKKALKTHRLRSLLFWWTHRKKYGIIDKAIIKGFIKSFA